MMPFGSRYHLELAIHSVLKMSMAGHSKYVKPIVAFNPLIVTFPFFVKLMPSCHLL
jgi:hypothetical protein